MAHWRAFAKQTSILGFGTGYISSTARWMLSLVYTSASINTISNVFTFQHCTKDCMVWECSSVFWKFIYTAQPESEILKSLNHPHKAGWLPRNVLSNRQQLHRQMRHDVRVLLVFIMINNLN